MYEVFRPSTNFSAKFQNFVFHDTFFFKPHYNHKMCEVKQISEFILTHLFPKSESKVKLWNLIFWRSSIPKDLLGGKVGGKYFYSHRGAPFWENWLQSWKIAILTPCLKSFPNPIWLCLLQIGTQKCSQMFPKFNGWGD